MWNDVSDNEIYVISPPHVASVDLLIGILVSTFNSFDAFSWCNNLLPDFITSWV